MAELSQRLEETIEGLDESKKKKLQQWKRDLIDTVEHEGEDMVAQRLKSGHILQLVEDDFFKEVITLAEKDLVKSYLETNKDRIKDELPSTTDDSFEVEKYEGLNKNELAMEMSRHCIEGKGILPVTKGERYAHEKSIKFFRYDRKAGLFRKISVQDLETVANQMSGKEYSTHLKRTFISHIKSSPARKHIDEMGLPENEILINNRKVLDISDPKDPEMRTVKQDDYALHKLNVGYDPKADCPEFKKFVWNLLDNDKESIKTVQEFLGWLLKFPNNDYQKALLILGESDTGKSQLTEIVEMMFTESSVSNLSMKMLGMDRPFHISKLTENIINIDRDLASQTIESPDFLKQIISQESLDAEDKGTASYKVEPTAKHLICSNVSPRIENTDDDGFYNRFLTVIAPNVIPDEDKINNFGEKIYENESSGILNWMLEGLARLEEQGHFTLQRKPYQNKNIWTRYGNSAQKFVWYECKATGEDTDFYSYDRLYQMYEDWVMSKLESRISYSKFKDVMREQSLFVQTKKYEDGTQKRGIGGIKVPEYDDMFSS